MTELLALQRRFMAQVIAPQTPQDTPQGMQAYRDAYLLRIDEALRTDFDGVHQILGDKEMLALTSDYIQAHPSRHPSIRWIGKSLPSFIAQSAHWSRIPLLADIARFEWSKSCLFDAQDDELATLADLQSIDPTLWGEMRIELISTLKVENFPANTSSIWQQLNNRESIASPTVEASIPWLMWRKERVINWRSLDETEAAALACIISGATFAELCQRLVDFVEDEEQVPNLAMQLLLQWCHDEIISSFQP